MPKTKKKKAGEHSWGGSYQANQVYVQGRGYIRRASAARLKLASSARLLSSRRRCASCSAASWAWGRGGSEGAARRGGAWDGGKGASRASRRASASASAASLARLRSRAAWPAVSGAPLGEAWPACGGGGAGGLAGSARGIIFSGIPLLEGESGRCKVHGCQVSLQGRGAAKGGGKDAGAPRQREGGSSQQCTKRKASRQSRGACPAPPGCVYRIAVAGTGEGSQGLRRAPGSAAALCRPATPALYRPSSLP